MTLAVSCLLLSLSVHVSSLSPNPSEVTCEAEKFYIGKPGFVTCRFNKNIRQHQHNFNVVFYPSNKNQSSSDSGIYVLLCNWAADSQMECKVESGFQFDYKVNDSLVVNIPNVTENAAGLYVCQLVPDEGIPVHTCTLTAEHPPTITTTTTTTTTTTSCNVTASVDASSSADKGAATVPLPVFIILAVILLIVVVVFISYIVFRPRICNTWHRLRRSSKQKKKQPQEVSEKAEEELLMDRIPYPAHTANKQTHTYVVTLDRALQVGDTNVVKTDDKATQIIEEEKTFLTGNLKERKGDIVMAGSAERYRNPIYYTLGTPLVVVPDHVKEKMNKAKQTESSEQ